MSLSISSPKEGQKVEQSKSIKINGVADASIVKIVAFADQVLLGAFPVENQKWGFERAFSQSGPRVLKFQGLDAQDALVQEVVREISVQTGWTSPLPKGSFRDGTYGDDSGADLHCPRGTNVSAVAPGVLLYSEFGHVRVYEGHEHEDTRYSILLLLDSPLIHHRIPYLYVWYSHLSSLTHNVRSGAQPLRVKKGDVLGKTGLGRGVPHLHFGIIHNRRQEGPRDWMPPFEVSKLVKALNA